MVMLCRNLLKDQSVLLIGQADYYQENKQKNLKNSFLATLDLIVSQLTPPPKIKLLPVNALNNLASLEKAWGQISDENAECVEEQTQTLYFRTAGLVSWSTLGLLVVMYLFGTLFKINALISWTYALCLLGALLFATITINNLCEKKWSNYCGIKTEYTSERFKTDLLLQFKNKDEFAYELKKKFPFLKYEDILNIKSDLENVLESEKVVNSEKSL